MQPTNNLRYFAKFLPIDSKTMLKKRFLQQWWEKTEVKENGYQIVGEWRDIPVVDDSE